MTTTDPRYEVQYHAGNPKLCRVKGLKIWKMPECEGGGWFTDPETARIICDALNQTCKQSLQDATEPSKEAMELADKLLTNGSGEKAYRLVLMSRSGRDLGGWCEKAIIDQTHQAISAARDAGRNEVVTIVKRVVRHYDDKAEVLAQVRALKTTNKGEG